MRRFLLPLLLLPLLAAGIFLGAFAASKLNVRGQSFFVSLGDFVFLNDGAFREALGADLPPLTEARYQAVIGRFRPHTHHYVEEQALVWLGRWGEAVVPRLAAELAERRDYQRTKGAIRALGRIGGEGAVAALGAMLAGVDRTARFEQVYYSYTVSALGRIPLPEASRALIAAYQRHPDQHQILAEIGRTGTPEAVAYLLGLARQGKPQRPADDDLIWGLAMSRAPGAARVLVDWLVTAEAKSARLCRDALDQFMRGEALEPLLDALERADNDPLRAVLLDLLDGPWVAGSPRSLLLLEPLLADPWLGDAARDTLARAGGRDAWLAVHRHLPDPAARAWLADDNLFRVAYRFGADALPELAGQLQAADPRVRRDTAVMLPRLFLPAARPYLEPLRADADPEVARAARTALQQLDKVDLFRSFTAALPERLGRLAWDNFRPDWFFLDFSYEAGFEAVWNAFAWLHLGGLLLSFLLGWALLTNALRVYESYRFSLFLLFLLAEGFIGDFLFCDHWPVDAGVGYQLATAIHLLLMIGYLVREREQVPGELRNRFERLGGASLWLLLPLLLVLGTPVYAGALRDALRQWPHFFAFSLLLTVLCGLVLEESLLPRGRLRRHYGFERLLGFALATWLLILFGAAVGRLGLARLAGGDADGAVVCLLLLAPLPWFLGLHLQALRPGEWLAWTPPVEPPPWGRLELAGIGPEITIHLVPPRSLQRRLLGGTLKLALILTAAGATAALAGKGGDLEGMILAVFAGIVGAALAGLLSQGVAPRTVLQVRGGYRRLARPRWGGVIGGSPWLRRPLPGLTGGAASGDAAALSPAERDWLLRLQAGTAGDAALPEGVDPAAVALFARPAAAAADPRQGLPVQLGLRNGGAVPVSLAALDQASRGRFVGATIDGAPASFCFVLPARRRQVPPGADLTLLGRLYPAGPVSGRAAVEVALVGPTVRTVPFRYRLRGDNDA